MTTLLPLEIPADHPAFAGHFPGDPMVPGVVLLDASLDAVASRLGIAITDVTVVSAKFVSPARPAEAVLLEFGEPSAGRLRLELRSGARPVASIVLAFNPAPEPA